MRGTLILTVCILLGAWGARAQTSLPANTQQTSPINTQTGTPASLPSNSASTVTGAIVPSGQGATGATKGGFGGVSPVAVACPFGVSLAADPTAFGCASDPLGAATYQIPTDAGAAVGVRAPAGWAGFNARTAAATAGAGSAGGTVSNARCQGAIASTAGNAGSADVFGGGTC